VSPRERVGTGVGNSVGRVVGSTGCELTPHADRIRLITNKPAIARLIEISKRFVFITIYIKLGIAQVIRSDFIRNTSWMFGIRCEPLLHIVFCHDGFLFTFKLSNYKSNAQINKGNRPTIQGIKGEMPPDFKSIDSFSSVVNGLFYRVCGINFLK
jgi:hypothetical protein